MAARTHGRVGPHKMPQPDDDDDCYGTTLRSESTADLHKNFHSPLLIMRPLLRPLVSYLFTAIMDRVRPLLDFFIYLSVPRRAEGKVEFAAQKL